MWDSLSMGVVGHPKLTQDQCFALAKDGLALKSENATLKAKKQALEQQVSILTNCLKELESRLLAQQQQAPLSAGVGVVIAPASPAKRKKQDDLLDLNELKEYSDDEFPEEDPVANK